MLPAQGFDAFQFCNGVLIIFLLTVLLVPGLLVLAGGSDHPRDVPVQGASERSTEGRNLPEHGEIWQGDGE